MKEQWASYKRVREAADELRSAIRVKDPDATFDLVRAADQPRSWHLLVMVDVDDPDEVSELVAAREIEMLVDELIPIHVIPLPVRERAGQLPTVASKRTG